MYIHVGEEILVKTKDIVAILDKDSVEIPGLTEGRGLEAVNLAKGTAKSIIVTFDKVYYSPLASGTLKKRSQKATVHDF